jgi:acetyl esterase/lipase
MKTKVIRLKEGRDDVTLTTYILQDSPDLLAGKARPAILICPGGGYFNCSDREAEPVAIRFAGFGYHTFVLRYSTYLRGVSGFPDLSAPPTPRAEDLHPAPMEDIRLAMRLICQKADEWLVDRDRIAVCGFSAGGHNAAMYATRWHELEEAPRPAAAIIGYPLTDYVWKYAYEAKQEGFVTGFFHASDTIFLGTPNPTVEQLEDVSPARHVTDKTPPCFIWATSTDELVPVQHSLLMAQALSEADIPYELHIFEQGMHGLSLADQSCAASLSQCSADVAAWSGLADKWLKKRFALPLPEKTDWELMLENGGFPG